MTCWRRCSETHSSVACRNICTQIGPALRHCTRPRVPLVRLAFVTRTVLLHAIAEG